MNMSGSGLENIKKRNVGHRKVNTLSYLCSHELHFADTIQPSHRQDMYIRLKEDYAT